MWNWSAKSNFSCSSAKDISKKRIKGWIWLSASVFTLKMFVVKCRNFLRHQFHSQGPRKHTASNLPCGVWPLAAWRAVPWRPIYWESSGVRISKAQPDHGLFNLMAKSLSCLLLMLAILWPFISSPHSQGRKLRVAGFLS